MIGSLGGAELVMIFVLALLIFGPRKLPQIGKTVGRALSEFRRATNDFKSSLEHEVRVSEVDSARREVTETIDEVKGVARGSLLVDEADDEAGEVNETHETENDPEDGGVPTPPPGQDGSRPGNS